LTCGSRFPIIRPPDHPSPLDAIRTAPGRTATAVDKEPDMASVSAYDRDYGLSSGIITSDEERGIRIARRVENGMTHINDCPLYDEPIAPSGGVKSSGVGRYGGRAAVEANTTTRWITLERGGRHYPF
jgi:aldehyde dehydrogenase (NAD+)